MKGKTLHNIIFMVAAFAVTMFFSCQDNYNEVEKIGVSANEPMGIAKEVNLKYTDSGVMVANLLSPKMLDFSNRPFAFTEFPEGIHLSLFDEEGRKSVVISDYAIVYDPTGLIDLQGNVILATYSNDSVFADQMYYDQKLEWLFTDQPWEFRSQGDISKGTNFDSDNKFNQKQFLDLGGTYNLDE
ncbi:MAG: LPS export ABC transporter periplasmic protein LptC [Bacteroidetes bacterium MedPE-SWsnd-G2]|nr:MAG: LPS export ABC transporter periplasmic protein LptC [Bacteroidetes bacterium MedPE-SWsnd-G2]